MMLTTHIRTPPRLRMSGTVPLFPLFTFMACTAATLRFLRMSGTMPLLPLFTFMACTAATLRFLTLLFFFHIYFIRTINYTCIACTWGCNANVSCIDILVPCLIDVRVTVMAYFFFFYVKRKRRKTGRIRLSACLSARVIS